MNHFFAWVTKIDLISFLSPTQDFSLVHNFLIAAHAGYVAAEDIFWVGVVIDTHDWKSFFDQMVIRQLHRHRFLVICMQLFVVRFCKPLASRLSADQVAGLKPAQEPAIPVKNPQTKQKKRKLTWWRRGRGLKWGTSGYRQLGGTCAMGAAHGLQTKRKRRP